MLRKIIIVLFILVFAGGIVYSYFYFRQIKRPVSNALNAIPSNAAYIIESRYTHELWKKVSETNLMWEALADVRFIKDLNENMLLLDSLYSSHPELQPLFNRHSLFISAHPSEAENNSFNFLITFGILPSINDEQIIGLVNSTLLSIRMTMTTKVYDNATIYTTVNSQTNIGFSFTVYRDLFIASSNALLVEDAIRHVNSGATVPNPYALQKVLISAGEKTDANIYINYSLLPALASAYIRPLAENTNAVLKNFGQWTELDISVKPNALMFNGFTYATDSVNNFLGVFRRQKPQGIRMTEILPSNTALLIHFGFSNFKSYLTDYKTFLEKSNSWFGREQAAKNIGEQCKCNVYEKMFSWAENEMALVITETSSQGNPYDSYVILRSANMETTRRSLEDINLPSTPVAKKSKEKNTYLKHEIKQLMLPSVFPLLFGDLFSGVKENYYTEIDSYIIFGNSENAIQDFIRSFSYEKTLAKSASYISLSENLYKESNLFVYANIGRSAELFTHFANDRNAKDIKDNKELFRKFESLAIQVSSEKDAMFYNNIYLKYNPDYKQETSSLWEAELDSPSTMKPVLLINHNTKAKDIFIQDIGNTIYLISNKGKVLWKKPLGEKILGDIHQVDVLKNGKLQILFNTCSKLHLLDRNGNYLANFPLKLKSPATAGLSVFDYDNNKNYRIFIPCEDRTIANFEKTGERVKGWEMEKTEMSVLLSPEYFSLAGKDYIISVDKGGKVYVVDRGGKPRMKLKSRLPAELHRLALRPESEISSKRFYIEKGKDILKTRLIAADSTGMIVTLYLDDNIQNLSISEFSVKHSFVYGDVNGDNNGEYIYADKNMLWVYSQDKNLLFKHEFEDEILSPQLFVFPGNKTEIGVVSPSNSRVFLVNSSGVLHEGFPLYGSAQFVAGDINRDGTYTLVVGSGEKRIYSYILE